MDLQAGEVLDEDVDVVEVGNTIVERYESLWRELTDVELFKTSERWRVTERINRLNALGFDVGELTMTTDIGGTTVSLQPKVVDAGHYHRQIMRWTGLDVQENQARRMLNDLEAYRAETDRQEDDPVLVAHDWMDEVFNPTVKGVPRELRRKLEPAEIFHEVLEHRWFLAEQEERNVPMMEAVEHYVETVLKHRPDERAFLDRETLSMPAIED